MLQHLAAPHLVFVCFTVFTSQFVSERSLSIVAELQIPPTGANNWYRSDKGEFRQETQVEDTGCNYPPWPKRQCQVDLRKMGGQGEHERRRAPLEEMTLTADYTQ